MSSKCCRRTISECRNYFYYRHQEYLQNRNSSASVSDIFAKFGVWTIIIGLLEVFVALSFTSDKVQDGGRLLFENRFRNISGTDRDNSTKFCMHLIRTGVPEAPVV